MTDYQVTLNQPVVDEAQLRQSENLRSYSQCVVCPTCKKIGFSRADQQCNALNLVFGICLPSCWIAHQVFKKKDLTCYNSDHSCTYCNANIASYQAC